MLGQPAQTASVRVQDPQDSRLTKDQYPRPRRRAPVDWHNRQPHPSFNGAPHLFSPLAPARLAHHWLTTSRKFGIDHLKLNQKKHLSGGLSRRPKRRAQSATNGRPAQQPHWLLQSHEPPGSPSARSDRRPGCLDRLDCFDLILGSPRGDGMGDGDKRPTGHSRTGKQRRSGIDTRSEKAKARLGERRSKVERRTGKGSKAKFVRPK